MVIRLDEPRYRSYLCKMPGQDNDIENLLQQSPVADLEKDQLAILQKNLADRINHLINTDFERLVSLLYRMDINEKKLKQLLQENPGTDAGPIIAELVIEREIQKIKSRRQFNQRDPDISEEDKW